MQPTFSKRILVVGDIMLDEYTDTVVRRISAEAPVPIAHVRSSWCVAGGAANVAENLACLGNPVTLIGARAKDSHGEILQDLLEQSSIIAPTVLVKDRPTICKKRIISHGQQLLRIDEEVTVPFTPDAVDRLWLNIKNALPWAQAVILSDYAKGLFASTLDGKKMVEQCIALCKEKGIPVLVDPKGNDWTCYRGANCLTPNTKELADVLHSDAEDFSRLCSEAFLLMEQIDVSQLLVTRGAKGMALLENGHVTEIATKAQEVADVSGAGDTVVAVLSACIAEGFSYEISAGIANRAAGIVVSRVGTSPVKREELLSALAFDDNSFSFAVNALSSKILTAQQLKETLEAWRRKKNTVVFTNGCFDLIHPGHVRLVQQAARFGDKLIVALNTDASVKRLKGSSRPIQSEKARALVMASMQGVDAVVLFDEDTPQKLIELVCPDVLVKGGDYTVDTIVGASFVLSHGGRVEVVDLIEGFSTSNIVSALTTKTDSVE